MFLQVVEDLQSSLPTSFVQELFGVDSPVLTLRYMASEKVRREGGREGSLGETAFNEVNCTRLLVSEP